jgi:hypothetical protein
LCEGGDGQEDDLESGRESHRKIVASQETLNHTGWEQQGS